MQGIGNDYIYVDAFHETIDAPAQLAIKIADRHFGVGGDGLILVAPPTDAGRTQGAQVRMRMFNADGSESEMCGNGVRCVAKFAFERGLATGNPLRVETGRGVLVIELNLDGAGKVAAATVDMGPPILEPAEIPADLQWLAPGQSPQEFQIVLDAAPPQRSATRSTVRKPEPATHGIPATLVSMGNPHAVIFTDNVAAVDLEKIGPQIENHPAFPRRINVHFVQVVSRQEIIMRTWERGSGITLACGTGASAVCVAGVLRSRTETRILAHLPGGDLTLDWRRGPDNAGSVLMTGPAVEVFSGQWP
jgi:diaminopimelate epimerase